MSIGYNIRRLRERYGLTQRELGDIAGVSDKAVSTWENGTKEPRMAAVTRLSKHFGIPLSEIIDEPAPENREFANQFSRLCTAWDRTPEQVAQELSLEQSRIKRLLQAKEQPSDGEVLSLAHYFHTTPAVLRSSELQLESEPSNVTPLFPTAPTRRIPVLGRVPAGIPIEAVTDIIEEIDLSGRFAGSDDAYFGLLVTGDSMVPEYRDGDVVIIRAQSTAETGDDVVAYINGSDATLKRLTVTANGIQLRPLNPAYPVRSFTNEEIEALPVTIGGIVVEQRRIRRR